MRLNNEVQGSKRFIEKIKLLFITLLLLIAVAGNYYYRNISFALRILFIFFIIYISFIIALITDIGKYTVVFAIEAITEVRKVIWPSRKDTLNTTLIVIAVTTLMSITLWCIDTIMVYIVSCMTSLRF